MRMIEFEAVIEGEEDGGAWVKIPPEIVDDSVVGVESRYPPALTAMPYRGSIAVYGGQHVLGVVKAVRRAIGKAVGDTVQVDSPSMKPNGPSTSPTM